MFETATMKLWTCPRIRYTLGLPVLIGFFAQVSILAASPLARTQDQQVPEEIQSILEQSCMDCHDQDQADQRIALDRLKDQPLDKWLELLNQMQEQVHFNFMPPEEAEPLASANRQTLLDWIREELHRHGASKLEEKLARPDYGNYINHDQLFSGEFADLPGFTYDRRWLISEFIFDAKMNRILNHRPMQTIDGQRESVIGDNNRRVNLTNPFLLPSTTGVRYYANETLNGGHLLTMMTNAKEVSSAIFDLAKRDSRYLPAITDIMTLSWQQQRTLETRRQFLENSIDQILPELYGDRHTALLPEFIRVDLPPPTVADGNIKKAPFHAAQPGNQELVLIFRTMQKLEQPGDTDQQLIEKCERDWFNFGHNPRQIQARVTFLNNYMEEWRGVIEQHRYAEKYKPLVYRKPADDEWKIIADTILALRKPNDHYATLIQNCMDQWSAQFQQELKKAGPPTDLQLQQLTEQSFQKILERIPTDEEVDAFQELGRSYFGQMELRLAIEKILQTTILRSEFVYRHEFGQGQADKFGRKMMSPRDASYAIALALTDSSPDAELVKAAQSGQLATREDYRREVQRLLAKRDQYYVIDEAVQRIQLTASITNLPIRKLRFFREFFGYPQMLPIFKDNKRFGGNYDNSKGRLVGEADRLVEHILKQDKRVIDELLTTDKFYVFHSGDNEAMTASSERIRIIYDYFKEYDWQNFEAEDLLEHKEFLAKVKMRGVNVEQLATSGRRNSIREFKTALESFTLRFDKGQTAAAPYVSFPAHGPYNASTRTGLQLRSPEVAKFFNIQLDHWDYPAVQPAPVKHRKGMLTHPAWLIAHAHNTATDPIQRGKWIREKLLAGTIPELPITVDAVIPEDHHKTLRQRLEEKTGETYCWRCHQQMNPLGLAFEMYDDFGRYRVEESLEHPDNLVEKGPEKAAVHIDLRDIYKTLPIDSEGHLAGTGNAELDGKVTDALDLIDRLGRSDRVRQSIIRHAFRYFMGRNETLSDSKTLIDADRAYLESDGSFDAVILSLLTSDSFIYRKPIPSLQSAQY
jgi:cytochrome c553